MLKIGAISDMHGILEGFTVQECDYLFIAGDVVPLKIQSRTKDTYAWVKETFIPWLESLPVKEKILMVPGNHDLVAERHWDEYKKCFEGHEKIVNLNCEFYEDNNLKVYGSPMCKIFGNWAFMLSQEEQQSIYDLIPTDAFMDTNKPSFLLTHDAPYGVSDIILQQDCRWADGSHIGNKVLRDLILRTQPMYNIHGHLHTTSHEEEFLGKTKVVCVSLLDENYEVVYEPTYIEV